MYLGDRKLSLYLREFIAKITTIGCLPEFIMSEQFVEYLWQRNKASFLMLDTDQI